MLYPLSLSLLKITYVLKLHMSNCITYIAITLIYEHIYVSTCVRVYDSVSEYVVIEHIIEVAQLKSPRHEGVDPDKSLLQYPHLQL